MTERVDAAELLGCLATRHYRQSPISGLRRALHWDKRRFAAALTVLTDAELIALSPNTVAIRDAFAPISVLLDRLTEHHLSRQE